jgi:uncharacterized protein involved in type VI secretion and phage assembly
MIILTVPSDKTLKIDSVSGASLVCGLLLNKVFVVTKESSFDTKKILGKPVALSFDLPDGKAKRYVNGIVTRI